MSIPLHERANLSIPEAMAYTRLSRRSVEEKLENGRWQWFWEGSRKRVIRTSIDQDQFNQAVKDAA